MFLISKSYNWAGDAVAEKSRMSYHWNDILWNFCVCLLYLTALDIASVSLLWSSRASHWLCLWFNFFFFSVYSAIKKMEWSEGWISPHLPPMPYVNSCFQCISDKRNNEPFIWKASVQINNCNDSMKWDSYSCVWKDQPKTTLGIQQQEEQKIFRRTENKYPIKSFGVDIKY